MNLEIVEKMIEYIEKNYHDNVSNEVIELTTGKSSGYVRNEFKKVVNISIDEYRIRRQLTLIIKEIHDLNGSLNNSNLSPWNTQNSFYKAFKNSFGETPMKFVKNYDSEKLQQKFDLEGFIVSYDNDKKNIEELIRKSGNKINALKYILSLRPYMIKNTDNLFIFSGVNIKEILIKRRYAQGIGDEFYTGKIPKIYYNYHSKLIDNYYDVKVAISFNKADNIDNVFSNKYIVIKKCLLNILLEYTGLDKIINEKTNPHDLVTIWDDEVKSEKIQDDIIAKPNELIDSGIEMMKWSILNDLVIQEQGFKKFETMEELKSDIKYDFSKPIDVFQEYCKKCNYVDECDDDSDCLYFEGLSENERQEFYAKPDHEVLTIKRLCEELNELIMERLIYFKSYEEKR